MKNLKRLVAAFAAAAMVMSMGVSAFAEVIEDPEVYDEDQKALVLDYTSVDEAQITMIAYLVDADTTAANIPEYTDQTIIALNQDVGATGFATIPIDDKKLEDGKSIVVKIGGSAGNITTYLIAREAEAASYSVTIDYNGGTGDEVSGLSFDDDDTIAAFFAANPITAPTKIDSTGEYIYEFEGWATADDAAVEDVIDETSGNLMTSLWGGTPAETVTLYAVYSATAATPAITVTFMNGSDVHAVVEVDENGKVALPATNPTLAASADYATTAYTFVEWVTEDGNAFDFDATVETSTVVYPKFKSNFVTGDINGDGYVRPNDRTFIHNYITSTTTPKANADKVAVLISEFLDIKTGDINGDGYVRPNDRTFIHNFITSTTTPKANADKVQVAIYVVNK